MTDHKKRCQLEKITCINKNGGCDAIVRRGKMAAHLRTCPANVLKCSSSCTPKEMGECFRVFRKEEICGHQKLTHVDLSDQTVIPCPLVSQGCDFTITRITPDVPKGKLVFSDITNSFTVIQENSVTESCQGNDEKFPDKPLNGLETTISRDNFCYIESIPESLLMKILLLLDSLSLNHLSRTSTYLRSACHEVLPKRGIVEHVWEKTGDGWRISQKVSFYCYIFLW